LTTKQKTIRKLAKSREKKRINNTKLTQHRRKPAQKLKTHIPFFVLKKIIKKKKVKSHPKTQKSFFSLFFHQIKMLQEDSTSFP